MSFVLLFLIIYIVRYCVALALMSSLLIHQTFFSTDTIQETILQCIKSISYHCSDPVVCFANVALKCPLSFTLTTTGLCPFYDDVRICIAYEHMTNSQLLTLQRMLDELENSKCLVNCSHLNGDFSVNAVRQGVSIHVDAAQILFCISRLIERATTMHNIDTTTVMNVIHQRITCSVHLHRQQIEQARLLIQAHISETSAQLAKSSATMTSEDNGADS